MATILEFSRSGAQPREQQSSQQSGANAGAEIIIFPGVRYEHWDDTAEADGNRIAIETDDGTEPSQKPRRRAAGSGRSAAAVRKKPRTERKRDILEIPD